MQRFFSAASQNRDHTKSGVRYGPGSAAHRAAKSGALRCVRSMGDSDGPREGAVRWRAHHHAQWWARRKRAFAHPHMGMMSQDL
jgi:hypothetical protein